MRLAILNSIVINAQKKEETTFNEVVALVEDKLLEWGLSWHTRRDYLRVLKLK